MNFSTKTNKLIKKATANKPHMKFTVGILHKGETSYKLFDSSGEIPYESHPYEMGSIGKTFTTSLFAKYVQEGKMRLDDSIAAYIPELDGNRYHPTLKRLATHTAGYPERYPIDTWGELFSIVGKQLRSKPINIAEYITMDRQKMIDLAKGRKLQDKDYKWEYSNFGISLLGQAVSQAADKPFLALMREFISQDLALSNTFVGTNHKNLVTGYDFKHREVEHWPVDEGEYIIPAGAGMVSNAEDLLQFANMHMEEHLGYLGLTHVWYDVKSKHSNMGLGWWIDAKNPDMFFHGGNTGGFASMLAFDKKKKTAVVILANVNFYREREALFADMLENLG